MSEIINLKNVKKIEGEDCSQKIINHQAQQLDI